MKNTQLKKKNLISQLFSKKEIVVTLPDYKDCVTVKIIDDENETVTGALGISDERRVELYEITQTALVNENISEILAKASKHVTHPNELAFVSFLIGYKLAKDSDNPFRGIIGAIIRGTQHGED